MFRPRVLYLLWLLALFPLLCFSGAFSAQYFWEFAAPVSVTGVEAAARPQSSLFSLRFGRSSQFPLLGGTLDFLKVRCSCFFLPVLSPLGPFVAPGSLFPFACLGFSGMVWCQGSKEETRYSVLAFQLGT